MRAREAALLAQRIGQRTAWLDPDHPWLAIGREANLDLFHHHDRPRDWLRRCNMRWGVIGISNISTPNGESASVTAFNTAAGAPIAPPSPTPLTPVMLASVMVSR